MFKRIAALAFIFVCTSIAWMILGLTISSRTNSPLISQLDSRVASNWGTAQTQSPPTATFERQTLKVETNDKGEKETTTETHIIPLPVDSSRIDVSLDLAHRQKGLLWYSTYAVVFSGDYGFANTSGQDQDVTFQLPFPSQQAMYDDLVLSIDGQPLVTCTTSGGACGTARVPAGKTVVLRVGYRSQGLDSWRYHFSEGVSETRNFNLHMRTNFKDIDFPENTLSPTSEQFAGPGWDLTWNYKDLVSGYEIGMTMPEKLQPGPLAGEISYAAPVSLFFFFFLMYVITTLQNIEVHPINYFFLATGFFAFHLLLAYLVDHISIHPAMVISSLVSLGLIVSYLRLVAGLRFALVQAGLAQLVYLVLFSYAFFWKGFTGLSITVMAVVTLFVVMQATGRIHWSERLAAQANRPTVKP